MRVRYERFNDQLNDLDTHLLLLGFIALSESAFASTRQITIQRHFIMGAWFDLHYVIDGGLFAAMAPIDDIDELTCFYVNRPILFDQIESTFKRLSTILKNYPAIDLEQLCQEAFRPSRVAYILSLDPDYEF